MTLDNIIEKLTESFDCILLRDKSVGNDYDFFCESLTKDIEIFLTDKEFVLTSKSSSYVEFQKYINKELISIEIANTIFRDNKFNIKLKKEYEVLYITDPSKNEVWFRSLKYLLSLNTSIKAQTFFKSNQNELIENNFYIDYLELSPFKKLDIHILLKEKKNYLLHNLKVQYLLALTLRKSTNIIKNILNIKIVSLIGVDGAGKTSIIEKFTENSAYRSVYFGGRDFMLEKFYNSLLGKGIMFVLLIRLLQYFENLSRYCKALYIAIFQGKIILFDRYPPIEYRINNNPKMRMFYQLFYRFTFPKIKKIIFIYADSNTIYNRKQELSIEEIDFLQNEIINSTFEFYKIDNFNGEIDKTLNNCLKVIYD